MSDVEDTTTSSAYLSPQHIKAQEFKNSGNDKFGNNNFKGAIVDYKKGLLHEQDNPDLHANLSAAYLHLEKFVDAEEHAVYAISLKPHFYKGYMRAAKAAHGKGCTRLALKRINTGLHMVSDTNGIKELNRLKIQYTSYLTLEGVAERELDFDSDTYQSDDEYDGHFSDDDDDEESDDSRPPTPEQSLTVEDALTIEDVIPEERAVERFGLEKVTADCEEQQSNVQTPSEEQKHKSSEDEQPKCKSEPLVLSEPEGPSNHQNKLEEPKPQDVEKEEEDNHEVSAQIEESVQKVEENLQPMETDVSFDKNETLTDLEPNRFLELCKELTRDPDLDKHVTEFKDYLKCGSEAFLSGNYSKAVDYFKAAEERVGVRLSDYEIDDRQYHVIKYLIAAAYIQLHNYDDIVKGIQILTKMEVYKFSIPAIYIQMAQGYYKLNRFKAALGPLELLQQVLDNFPIFPTFTWPGTTETIQETTPAGLKNALKELNQLCRMSNKPTAICRFDNCIKISTHIVPSDAIYFSDPDFIGYVRMICEEKCHIEFHISCWKAYKESICGIGKVNDKDMLGRRCLTTDCVNGEGVPSMVTMIEIIDSEGNIKSVNKVDPKATGGSKNARKRKCKLDDKENRDKSVKTKKAKEKKVRDVKKPTVTEEEVEVVDTSRLCADPQKALETRKQSLIALRNINFGLDEKYWNPRLPCYGRSDETTKAECGLFLGQENNDSKEVRDVKDFFFSYFQTVLKDEGPLNQSEVEEFWTESTADFCDVKGVLPNMKSVCELLLESTRFCQLEDYICLSDQLEEAYQQIKCDTVELVNFLMNGNTVLEDGSQAEASVKQSHLPDLLRNSADAQSSSEDEPIVSDSGEESEPSEDEASDEEEGLTLKPADEGSKIGFSIQDMITEMLRLKSSMKNSDETKVPLLMEDFTVASVGDEEGSADTFYTACGSSFGINDNQLTAKQLTDNNDEIIVSNDESTSDDDVIIVSNGESSSDDDEPNTTIIDSMLLDARADGNNIPLEEATNDTEEGTGTDAQQTGDSQEYNKASQCEVTTEEKNMQTLPKEANEKFSQTDEFELYEQLRKKVVGLTNQLEAERSEKEDLLMESKRKGLLCDELMTSFKEVQNKHLKAKEALRVVQEEKASELAKKESKWRLKEAELSCNLKKLESKCSSLVSENEQNKSALVTVLAQQEKMKTTLATFTLKANEWESKYKEVENAARAKVEKSQRSQLNILKSFWENQVILLRKRCVEKISEMQVWFSLTPTEEMEQLPSLGSIQQIITRWGEISRNLHHLEDSFKVKFNELESKICMGEELEDLSIQILPPLPEEPMPLPLDKVHKEITEKHLKKIGDLTQLVVNQQLEIHQLMNTFQMSSAPRTQSPMTTAFGSLALQYPYPQFGQTPAPSVQTPAPAISKLSASVLQTDVQTLLQESSKATTSMKQSGKAESVKPVMYASMFSTLPSSASSSQGPPPPMGVAQNLLKNTSSLNEKKESERLVSTPEPVKSRPSRESTPVLNVSATPEKSKKKKKAKAENREVMEVKEPTPPANAEASQEDDTEWNVVLPKGALLSKQSVAPLLPTESKLKNKKKLLDKLQHKFPTIPLRELDELVKLVREQNNGSLSGLLLDDIESRVEMIITKKHVNKTSPLSVCLVKLSSAAWGVVRPQENITCANLQVEECTICLDRLGEEKTKIECNHEFHTKCLRKWLKEKSVCPLCNKFTTMPDEFPAL